MNTLHACGSIKRTLVAMSMLLTTAALCPHARGAEHSPKLQAKQILSAAGVPGGFVVHVGCGDGKLTAALRANDKYLVQGLDKDGEQVAAARAHVRSLGLYGNVTIDRFTGGRLPYIDNLVNLLVLPDDSGLSRDEILRVLAPNGVACIRQDDGWSKVTKPWPAEIDEWTHYLQDASNNAVAQDTVVGPPKHFQWIGSPRWLRHHDHTSGLSAMVSARGRLFYIMDLGPRWSIQMPPQWTLIARDAFNGVVLWQRKIQPWHHHLWPLKKGPAQPLRRLVAEGETVYVTLGVGAPVVALDAATGRELRTYEGSAGAEEMILSDGLLLVVVNPDGDAYRDLPRASVEAIRGAGRSWNWDERPRRIMAFDAATGKLRWKRTTVVAPLTLAAADSRAYYHDGDKIMCLDANSGKDVWKSPPIARWKPMHVLFGPTLVLYDDVVLFAGGERMDPLRGGKDTMTALAAETGKVLWTAPHPPSGYASAEDLLVVDGLVWCGVTTNRGDSGVFTGRDPRTGEVRCEFPPDDWPHMPHHRCYRAKATCNYILTSRTGIEFVDFRAKHWTAHHWVRGSCNYGILPCNGLVYAPPHSCACYLLAKLSGLNALAPERAAGNEGQGTKSTEEVSGTIAAPAAERLEQGPAYETEIPHSARPIPHSEGWPTYRHDAARSGSTTSAVPAELSRIWRTKIGGRLSSLVVADGRAFVASIDRHTVHALDADSGKPLWQFTAGGRVDSPPTIWHDRVLFGSADGFVYCLTAAEGRLAWRFRAVPLDSRMMAREQVESVWPVPGSVLVREGIVYCVAGRSMWLDGGLRLLRLEARTGQMLSETILDDKYPGTQDNLQRDIKWPNLPVALPDVLSSNDRHVYMRSQPFDFEGKRTDVITPRRYGEQQGETAHLFCPTGFLDDSWWHRSYWLYGRSFVSGAGGWYLAGYQAPAGRILVMDDTTIYGFGRAPLRFAGTPITYHLFACDKPPETINPNPKQPPRRRGSSVYGPVVATRLKYRWSHSVPLMVRAMVATDQSVFAAGPPVTVDEMEVYAHYGDPDVQARMADQVAAFAGSKGAVLLAVSKAEGKKVAAYRLETAPVFDGLVAAGGRLMMSTLDGSVICLGAGANARLPDAPNINLGPVPAATAGFVPSKSHPDFQHLTMVHIAAADLGYRLRTAPSKVGLAVRKLDDPLTKRAEFRLKVRVNPGAPPDKPGNAFLAFGDGPQDEQLVKCGFRIAGQRLYIVQGPLLNGRSTSQPLNVKSNEVVEIHVVVDLATQKVTASLLGQTVEASLERKLDAVGWIGCCVNSVTSDFGRVKIEGE